MQLATEEAAFLNPLLLSMCVSQIVPDLSLHPLDNVDELQRDEFSASSEV